MRGRDSRRRVLFALALLAAAAYALIAPISEQSSFRRQTQSHPPTDSARRVDVAAQADAHAPRRIATPLSIAVKGNQLVDGADQSVTLHGTNIDGTEWSCLYAHAFATPNDQASIDAMAAWHINAVRIPLNEDCWLGINGAPSAVTAYHEAIRDYVNRLHADGLYAILDLHWTAPGAVLSHVGPGFTPFYEMADEDHSPAFWESVASYFRDDHAILFDLFNEPRNISWACWLNGCALPRGFQAAGMQQLVDAVRNVGATQPVMVGGQALETQLGQEWLANRPSDPAGQLVAAAHLYGYHPVKQLNTELGVVAAKVPVVIGEAGELDCADTEIANLLQWADTNKVSYLAWEWVTGGCVSKLSLISNYNGAPTNYGLGYREHLLKAFPAPTAQR
jgi:endoglucanase